MNSLTPPLVSIITVTCNAQDVLEQTMLSVFNQTYPHIEYIIMDGSSTDATVDIIKKYESRLSIWVSEKDAGIYDAMNKGIRLAKGVWIGMINAGDYYLPDAVETMVQAMQSHPEWGIVHGNIHLLDKAGTFIKLKKPETDMNNLYKGMSVYHPTFFVRKTVYEENGLFDTRFKISADFDFALRNHRKGVQFGYVDHTIAEFRAGGFSEQGDHWIFENREILRKYGYSEELITVYFNKWKRRNRRNILLRQIYTWVKKFIPQKVVEFMAKNIKPSKY
jgi:glycosyltransferase involved in cell wall biosynthesis